jgi:nucleoside-diphosphate kinase
MARERTYIMVKPDGVQRGLIGEIVRRFEQRGFQLLALKMMQPSPQLLQEHYVDLKSKAFFESLVAHMSSGPVVCMVFSGKNVVNIGRDMLGKTNPMESAPGTIRGDFAIDIGRNVCHGSDSVTSAEREISIWFPEGVIDWAPHGTKWIYE